MYPTLTLAATAFNQQQLLDSTIPQIALAGRSNVGKSSLINALAKRKQLAKTSATPGKTRSINYYSLETPVESFLVDLPGYGYARCSQQERLQWAKLLEHYLTATPGLTALVLLLDARLSPQKIDKALVNMAISASLPIIPVLTKVDKCNRKELNTCLAAWQKELGPDIDIMCTSSAKKEGIIEVWQVLLNALTNGQTAHEKDATSAVPV